MSMPWFDLPTPLALLQLVRMRDELRRLNLYDTEEPPLLRSPGSSNPGAPGTTNDVPRTQGLKARGSEGMPPGAVPADVPWSIRGARAIDGRNNDLSCPEMGAVGRRFGRNVPLDHTFPDIASLFTPSPRVVSRALMTRDAFRPATSLNLLAAAWIQCMVHDWFAHRRSSADDGVDLPLAHDDDWPDARMRVPRTVPDPAPAGSTRPPAYANPNGHWWDGSQIYGSDPAVAASLRTGIGGKLRLDDHGLLPVDPITGLHQSGFTDNWWVGLAMLHTMFTREHNVICDDLAAAYPSWDDERLYGTAALVNSALMAKIHTVEWTPAILPHPTFGVALRGNWSGLAGETLQDLLPLLNDREILGGIVGSPRDHHGVCYSLTEEFVSVYRLHPLIPDTFVFRRLDDDEEIERVELPDVSGRHAAAMTSRIAMSDLFYSFGRAHPGAVTLHNYPRHLQDLTRDNGEHFDLAAVDIYRDRERGVPRYNAFRCLLRKPPVGSFEELTDNVAWREKISDVYGNDLEAVDLMTGLFAEPLPPGFGFSETAFRVFVLMASRRLASDRFFTDDYRPEIYTEIGLRHVRDNSMLTVLRRHYPALQPALEGVTNAFQPWTPTGDRKSLASTLKT
jgi:hypothetical protein